MSIASGIGASINALNDTDLIPVFFGEDQGRYIVTIPREKVDWLLETRMAGVDVPLVWIGTTGGVELKLGEARGIPVAELKAAHDSWFPRFMNG